MAKTLKGDRSRAGPIWCVNKEDLLVSNQSDMVICVAVVASDLPS